MAEKRTGRPMTRQRQAAAEQPVKIYLAPALRRLFPDADPAIELCASTVGEMLDALEDRWPGMRNCLRDSRPAVRRHINIFVNGERSDLATALPPGAEIHILTAISGG